MHVPGFTVAPPVWVRQRVAGERCNRRGVLYAVVKTRERRVKVGEVPEVKRRAKREVFREERVKEEENSGGLSSAEEQALAVQIGVLRVHERVKGELEKQGKKNGEAEIASALGMSLRQFQMRRRRALNARDKLVTANLKLVTKIANMLGGERQDLVQEGCIALIRAAERFEPKKGRFSSFAFKAVWRKCRRFVEVQSCIVRVPHRLQLAIRRGEGGDRIEKAKRMMNVGSLDVQVGEGKNVPLVELVAVEGPEDFVHEDMVRELIREACLKWLSERDARIVCKWSMGKTMKDVGTEEGVTEARVSQICNKAVKVLREREPQLKQVWLEM